MSTVVYSELSSPLGTLLLTGDGRALTGVYLPRHRQSPVVTDAWRRDDEVFADARSQFDGYFAGARRGFSLRLAATGTPFQQAVWQQLASIPYATTTTYGAVAAVLDRPAAIRAVAAAVARNPLSIVVPCHRVVGADGTLTGYAGGLAAKAWLLDLERTGRPGATLAPTG